LFLISQLAFPHNQKSPAEMQQFLLVAPVAKVIRFEFRQPKLKAGFG
jgi:hypothetical protein